jgi:REP element-mobilizing transposase RayT
MSKIARIVAPEYPHHVTQRGNNRAVVFFDDQDRHCRPCPGTARTDAPNWYEICPLFSQSSSRML